MEMLLLLRDGRIVPASELAARFAVSTRTVYRDLDMLSGLGVPIASEMGRSGGVRLGDGYFLPPIALGPEEAVSLLLGLILMRRLRVMPFPKEAGTAERKLLAALPERTRDAVSHASRSIGFERVPADLLHPERGDPQTGEGPPVNVESDVVGSFLRAMLSHSRVSLAYSSPYRDGESARELEPLGLVWDRDRWYLAGRPSGETGRPRMYRADRVASMGPGRAMPPVRSDFNASELLDRVWLRDAMDGWREESPVIIVMTPEQAALLEKDWFYGNALFERLPDGRVRMTYGEFRLDSASALLRWLGPGAELLEPAAWRSPIADGLREMAKVHERGRAESAPSGVGHPDAGYDAGRSDGLNGAEGLSARGDAGDERDERRERAEDGSLGGLEP